MFVAGGNRRCLLCGLILIFFAGDIRHSTASFGFKESTLAISECKNGTTCSWLSKDLRKALRDRTKALRDALQPT